MLYAFGIILIIAALAIVILPFTVILHELGHAIPAILLTGEKVSIYIGSYGDPNKSLKFRIGLLEVWFKYNPFLWKLGMCIPSKQNISINRKIIYVLTGPITSFLLAIIACYFTFSNDLHGMFKLVFLIFLGSSVLDLIVNLTPNERPLRLFDGKVTYNDGFLLKSLFYYKFASKEFLAGVDLFNNKRYDEACEAFDKMLANGKKSKDIYRLAIQSSALSKRYDKAKGITDLFNNLHQLNSDDYANAALVYSYLDLHEEANRYYDLSLELNPFNKHSLNNKGYFMNYHGYYLDAIPLFDRAIEVDDSFAYSYNNRGLSKIKLGMTEEGLQDIERSIKLDENNAYAYRNLGIYHSDLNNFEEALRLFTKAKELDSDTHMIDELISQAEQKHQTSV